MMEPETFEHEFNQLARWTADAIATGEPGDAIPGACNGSGNPGALAWLAAALAVGPQTRLIDTGAGLGGAAAWLRERCGVDPFVVEPMAEAARGSRRLFALRGVVAWAHQLPFAAASFDVALALAVLSTADDKEAYLRELQRTLRPGGGLGILEYVLHGPQPADAPVNNDLLAPDELRELLTRTGFEVVDTAQAGDLPDKPPEWVKAERRVRGAVAAAHAGEAALIEADEQEDRFASLLKEGRLRLEVVHARAVERPSRTTNGTPG